MKDKLLDTNCILRFVLNDIPEQYQKVNSLIIDSIDSNLNLFILPETIIEISYVLSKVYGIEKKIFIPELKTLLGITSICLVDSVIIKKTLDLFLVKNISIEDCYYIAHCIENNLEFISFDKKALNIYNSLKS